MQPSEAKDRWKVLAEELGWSFETSARTFFESLAAKRFEFEDLDMPADALRVLSNPLIGNLLAQVFFGYIQGVFRGYTVNLYRGARHSSTRRRPSFYMNLILFFADPRAFDLDVSPESDPTESEDLEGSDVVTISTGHRGLDSLVRARGRGGAGELLSNASVQARMVKLFEAPGRARVNDHGIHFRMRSEVFSVETIRARLDLMADVAEAMS